MALLRTSVWLKGSLDFNVKVLNYREVVVTSLAKYSHMVSTNSF